MGDRGVRPDIDARARRSRRPAPANRACRQAARHRCRARCHRDKRDRWRAGHGRGEPAFVQRRSERPPAAGRPALIGEHRRGMHDGVRLRRGKRRTRAAAGPTISASPATPMSSASRRLSSTRCRPRSLTEERPSARRLSAAAIRSLPRAGALPSGNHCRAVSAGRRSVSTRRDRSARQSRSISASVAPRRGRCGRVRTARNRDSPSICLRFRQTPAHRSRFPERPASRCE